MTIVNNSTLFEQFAGIRNENVRVIDSISPDQVNTIPAGFRNNIYWQSGHLVEEQVSLLYSRVGLPRPLDEKYTRYFDKGTSPNDFDGDMPTFEEVRRRLEQLVDRTREDLTELADLYYSSALTVSLGQITINTFSEALSFVTIHEAYHLGMITAMKRVLS